MKTFLKGIIVGMGGIAPGLSGSVLLVIFGLYEKVIDAIGNIFKNFKKNLLFLIPLFLGFGIGVLIFGKIVDILLEYFPMQTRFAFLGLVIGTLPLFYKEVKKNGFSKKYYILIGAAAVVGLMFFIFNKDMITPLSDPNYFESFLLGIAVAASSIIPGVDSAVILSALGLYEAYISAIANFSLHILIPAVLGVGVGALVISFIMSKLISRFYTVTFSIIFGFFISIIPSVLDESCTIGADGKTAVSFILLIVGFLVSFYLGDIKKGNERVRRIFKRNTAK